MVIKLSCSAHEFFCCSSVDVLTQESGVSLEMFDVAHNVDLTQVLQVWPVAQINSNSTQQRLQSARL
jgi:hypothetical protein